MTTGNPGATDKLLAHLVSLHGNVSIVTTNFDTLIEQCLQPRFKPAINVDDYSQPGVNVQLAKVHGCLTNPAGMVVNMRQIAAGLPKSISRWLEERLAKSTFVYLGYGANDFDIFPLIIGSPNSTAGDVFTIKPKCPNGTDEFLFENHTRQRRVVEERGGYLVVNCTDVLKCLFGEFSVTEDVSHEATLPLSRSPIIFEPIGQCLSYLLALLEFTGHTYEGQDIIAAANRLSIPVEIGPLLGTMHQAGRFDDISGFSKAQIMDFMKVMGCI